jgi:hypothetical protein
MTAQPIAVDPAPGGQHRDQRKQQRRVGAGADRQVLVCDRGGLAAPRVDHHHLAAALADGTDATARVGRRHHAAVRDDGVGADAQQHVRAIDVGHGDREGASIQQEGRGEARAGVLRRRARPVSGSERGHERIAHQHDAVLVDEHAFEARLDDVERFAPGDGFEVATAEAPHRSDQPIGIAFEVEELDPFRTDEALRDHVFVVRVNSCRPSILHVERQPAASFAERARPKLPRGTR